MSRGLGRGSSGQVSVRPIQGSPTAYSPAITWPGNTLGSITAQCLRTPGELKIWGTFSNTSGTASAVVNIPLPAGMTVYYPPSGVAFSTGLFTFTTIQIYALTGIHAATSINTFAALTAAVGAFSFYATIPVAG